MFKHYVEYFSFERLASLTCARKTVTKMLHQGHSLWPIGACFSVHKILKFWCVRAGSPGPLGTTAPLTPTYESKNFATWNLFSLRQGSGKKFVEQSGKFNIENIWVKITLEYDRFQTKTSDISQEIFHIFPSWAFSRFWSRLLIFDNLWLGTNIHLENGWLRIQSCHSRNKFDLLHRFSS